jgi:NTE family protein
MNFGWPNRSPATALALQGGGAHGAFTWGVLDALLECDALRVAAISGTSAGAVNAVVLAHGLLRGGNDGAREALARLWDAVGRSVPWDALGWVSNDAESLSPTGRLMLRWMQALSPAQRNPLQVDPLRALLNQQVDFEMLRGQHTIALHIAATHANSGRLRLFTGREVSLDAVLASACLPTLQRAVMIDGEPYWDGGYSANPALSPLLSERRAGDLLIVMLSPWLFGDTPHSAEQIRERALDLAFNAAFLREMQMLAEATAVARRGWLPLGPLERRLRKLRWHLIDGDDALAGLDAHSKLIAHPTLIARLHEAGREQASTWLERHRGALGRRSSIDLAVLFADHLPAPRAS